MILVLLAFATFAVGTTAYVVSGVLPEVAAELDVSVAAAGQLATAFALAYAVGAPVLATLAGRWERRRLITVALVVAGVGNLASALAPTYPLLIGARVLTALGAAALTPAATHAATLLAAPERRGRAVAGVFTGLTLALVIGVPAGTLLAGALGFRGVFAAVAGLCLLGAVLVRAVLPTVPAPPPIGLRARFAVAANPAVLAVLAVLVLGLLSVISVYTYIAPLLAETAGVTGAVLSAVLVAYGIGALIGNDLGGRLTDRYGGRRVLLVALPATVVLLATLPLTATTVPGAALALLGLGGGWLVGPAIQTRLLALDPSGSGLLLALNASAIYLGSGLGGVVGGLVVQGLGVAALPGVAAGVAAASVLLLLVALRAEPATEPRAPAG